MRRFGLWLQKHLSARQIIFLAAFIIIVPFQTFLVLNIETWIAERGYDRLLVEREGAMLDALGSVSDFLGSNLVLGFVAGGLVASFWGFWAKPRQLNTPALRISVGPNTARPGEGFIEHPGGHGDAIPAEVKTLLVDIAKFTELLSSLQNFRRLNDPDDSWNLLLCVKAMLPQLFYNQKAHMLLSELTVTLENTMNLILSIRDADSVRDDRTIAMIDEGTISIRENAMKLAEALGVRVSHLQDGDPDSQPPQDTERKTQP